MIGARRRGTLTHHSAGSGTAPDTIANLALWLAGDSIPGATDNNPISSWPDKSSAANNCTQASSPAQPLFLAATLNGLPVVRFNQHWMTVPSATTSGATAGTIFYLAKHDSSPPPGSAGAGAVAFNWGGAADNEFEPFGDSKIYQDFGSTVRYGSIAVPSSFASWQIYVYRAESGRWRCYQGGGVAAKDSGTNTVAWSASPTLGNASSVTLIGHVAELVFYRAALTNAQVNGVGAYLANKYAVSWSTV